MAAVPCPTNRYHNKPTPTTDPTQDHLSVAGKSVLVTGGGTTIGAAIVEAFAKAKAEHIFLIGRRLRLLKEVKDKLSKTYTQTTFHAVQTDISKEGDIDSLFREISNVSSLDVLVANAGYFPALGVISTSETADWWKGFEINALGTFLLAKAFLHQQHKGTPVFIGVNTGSAHVGPRFRSETSGYNASKLAAASTIEFLQAENPDIKAFNVMPGIVRSEMSDKGAAPREILTDSPELMAHMAVWLAGPDSDFLKGRFIWANWDVDELVAAKEKIVATPNLFTLTLEGWSDGFAVLK